MENFNFEQTLEELASTIPTGQRGAEMIEEMGYQKSALISYLRAFGCEIDRNSLSKRIQTSFLMDGVEISGASTAELFTGVFRSLYSNMKNGSYLLPEGEHKVIFGIIVESGDNSANQPPITWDGSGSNAIVNGTLTLKNNGTVVASEIPLARAERTLTTNGKNFIALNQPIVWKGQTDLTAQFKTESPAASAVLRITYVGFGLVS